MTVIGNLNRWVLASELQFDCPECGTRNMRMYKNDPRQQHSAEAWRRIAAERSMPDYMVETEGVFVATFECRNTSCGQSIAVGGDWAHWINDGDEETQDLGSMVDAYRIRFIHPPVLLFPVPTTVPAEVVASVRAASTVVWVDPPAAASRLRMAVERLLDHKRVPRPRGTTLHRRLQAAEADPRLRDIAVLLFAVKWIGNSGAHDDKLTTENVLEAAEILEEALRQLYDRSASATRRKAMAIHRRKSKKPKKSAKKSGSATSP